MRAIVGVARGFHAAAFEQESLHVINEVIEVAEMEVLVGFPQACHVDLPQSPHPLEPRVRSFVANHHRYLADPLPLPALPVFAGQRRPRRHALRERHSAGLPVVAVQRVRARADAREGRAAEAEQQRQRHAGRAARERGGPADLRVSERAVRGRVEPRDHLLRQQRPQRAAHHVGEDPADLQCGRGGDGDAFP